MTNRNELEKLLAAATEGPWGIAAYYTGTGPDERDFSWAHRHEVSKLMAERGREVL